MEHSFLEELKHIVAALRTGSPIDAYDPNKFVPVVFNLPSWLEDTWKDGFEAFSLVHGDLPTYPVYLETLLDAYLAEWARKGLQSVRLHRLVDRDGWKCTVPTCTRRARLQKHHIRFRSDGGCDCDYNVTTLCLQHHQLGVHMGRILLSGTAPDGLTWMLGVDENGDVHMVVEGREIVRQAA